jgi:hypothetical protein
MVDFRSEKRKIGYDKRKHPRVEFRCNASVFGVDGVLTVTDLSLGGIFVEVKLSSKISIGKSVNINLKLPTEKKVMRLKAKVTNQTDRGIGCQLTYDNERERKAIYKCFDFVKDTLPVE